MKKPFWIHALGWLSWPVAAFGWYIAILGSQAKPPEAPPEAYALFAFMAWAVAFLLAFLWLVCTVVWKLMRSQAKARAEAEILRMRAQAATPKMPGTGTAP